MKRRNTGPSEAVVKIVKARARDMCECCNLRPGKQVHHLLPRRAGGTRRPEINLPSNLVLLAPQCHSWVENNRTEALKLGLLRSDGVNQLQKPVRLWHGLVRLDNFGGWQRLPQNEHTAGCAVWTSNEPCDCAEEAS